MWRMMEEEWLVPDIQKEGERYCDKEIEIKKERINKGTLSMRTDTKSKRNKDKTKKYLMERINKWRYHYLVKEKDQQS